MVSTDPSNARLRRPSHCTAAIRKGAGKLLYTSQAVAQRTPHNLLLCCKSNERRHQQASNITTAALPATAHLVLLGSQVKGRVKRLGGGEHIGEEVGQQRIQLVQVVLQAGAKHRALGSSKQLRRGDLGITAAQHTDAVHRGCYQVSQTNMVSGSNTSQSAFQRQRQWQRRTCSGVPVSSSVCWRLQMGRATPSWGGSAAVKRQLC